MRPIDLTQDKQDRPSTAAGLPDAASVQSSSRLVTRDTTVRQVGERIKQANSMIADGLAEVAVLTALHTEMIETHAPSVSRLSPASRATHREAIRLSARRGGGVEMW